MYAKQFGKLFSVPNSGIFLSYLHTTSSVNQLFSLFQILLRDLLLNWCTHLVELNFSDRPVNEIWQLKLILVSYATIFHFLESFIWDSYLGSKSIGKSRQWRENVFISSCIFERALEITWKGKDQWIEDYWEVNKRRNSRRVWVNVKWNIEERQVWPVKVFPQARKNLSYSCVSVLLYVVFRYSQSSNAVCL